MKWSIASKEALADFGSFHKSPKLISESYMEEQLSKIYAFGIFKKFQDEIKALMNCSISLFRHDGSTIIYEVKERIKKKDGKMEHRNFEV